MANKSPNIHSNKLLNSPYNKLKQGKSKKINSFLYDRTKFILKLLKNSVEKLAKHKETSLAKGLQWLTKEVEESLLFRTDDAAIKNLETLKKENKDFHTIFSWLEEYSTIKIRRDEYVENLKNIENLQNIPLTAVKNYLKNDLKTEQIRKNSNTFEENIEGNFLVFSEDCLIKIETPEFDIFSLEKEVGSENILQTVSCYAFSSLGYYSLIHYKKFENFIAEIAKGYDRRNPYHNVSSK